MIRTTVALEPNLLRRLKEEAFRSGLTLQSCVNKYLRLGLEQSQRRSKGNKWGLPVLALGKPLIDPRDRQIFYDLSRRA